MISLDAIEDVRCAVDAVALIGAKVKLRASGESYFGRCPFHEGRERTFRVYPAEKRFVCYQCGARGDVFEFLVRLEGRPFPAVVRELAAGVGVELPKAPLSAEEKRAREERMALLAACEAAAAHWQNELWGEPGEPARHYLAARGVSEQLARSFRLGYAGNKWHDLECALSRSGLTNDVLHAAGLLAAREKPDQERRYYGRFRQRIVFPIEDAVGRIIGFGGRAIGSESEAKYLNGPETKLYKKARALYGLHRARDAIWKTGTAILVEGYFDALALHAVGHLETVAVGGTSLTPDHVKLLRSSGCRKLVLLFDGDEAGARAPAKAGTALLQAGLSTTVAELNPTRHGASDPDALVRRFGKAGVDEVIAHARPLTEFLIDDALWRDHRCSGPPSVEQKLRALRDLMPFVLAAPEGIVRSTFEKAVARRLAIDIGPLRLEIERAAHTHEMGGFS